MVTWGVVSSAIVSSVCVQTAQGHGGEGGACVHVPYVGGTHESQVVFVMVVTAFHCGGQGAPEKKRETRAGLAPEGAPEGWAQLGR